jgi:hypothetical protein
MYFKRPVLVEEYRDDEERKELLQIYFSAEEEDAKRWVSEDNLSKRERYREWFNEYKSNYRCLMCRERSPETLQFHHLDPQEKKYTITEMVKKCMMFDMIERELEKCVVLCSNCHYKAHRGLFKSDEIKSKAEKEYKYDKNPLTGYSIREAFMQHMLVRYGTVIVAVYTDEYLRYHRYFDNRCNRFNIYHPDKEILENKYIWGRDW